jgi:hypothetical protein
MSPAVRPHPSFFGPARRHDSFDHFDAALGRAGLLTRHDLAAYERRFFELANAAGGAPRLSPSTRLLAYRWSHADRRYYWLPSRDGVLPPPHATSYEATEDGELACTACGQTCNDAPQRVVHDGFFAGRSGLERDSFDHYDPALGEQGVVMAYQLQAVAAALLRRSSRRSRSRSAADQLCDRLAAFDLSS